jgi:putative transposase
MVTLASAVVAYLRTLFVPRHKLALEAAALRQQLSVFKRKQPRPKLDPLDRLFWIVLRRLWDGWSEALIVVRPETVVSWHRAGFRRFWRWRTCRALASRMRRTARDSAIHLIIWRRSSTASRRQSVSTDSQSTFSISAHPSDSV